MWILIYSIHSILVLLTIVSLANSTPISSSDDLNTRATSSDIKIGLLPVPSPDVDIEMDLDYKPDRKELKKLTSTARIKAEIVKSLAKEMGNVSKSKGDNKLRIFDIPMSMDNFVFNLINPPNKDKLFYDYSSLFSLSSYINERYAVRQAYLSYKDSDIDNPSFKHLYNDFVIYPAIVTFGENVSAFFLKEEIDEYIVPEKVRFTFDGLVSLYEYLKDQGSILSQEYVFINHNMRKCIFLSKHGSEYIPHILAAPRCLVEFSPIKKIGHKERSLIYSYQFIAYLLHINFDTSNAGGLTIGSVNTMINEREKTLFLPSLDIYFKNIGWTEHSYYNSITNDQKTDYAQLTVEYVLLLNVKLAQIYNNDIRKLSNIHDYDKVDYKWIRKNAFSQFNSLQEAQPLKIVDEDKLSRQFMLLSKHIVFDITKGKSVAVKVFEGAMMGIDSSKLLKYAKLLRNSEIIKSNPNILLPTEISRNGSTYKVYFESRKNYLIRGDHFLCEKKIDISKCKFIPFNLNTMKTHFKQVFKAIDDIYKTGIPFSIESVNVPKDIIYDSYTGEFSVIPTINKFWKPNLTCSRGKLPKTLIDMEKETVFCLGLYYISMRGFSHDFFGPFSVRDKKDFQESIAISIALIQSKSEKNLVSKMLHWDPSKRASLMEVYNHSFWQEREIEEHYGSSTQNFSHF